TAPLSACRRNYADAIISHDDLGGAKRGQAGAARALSSQLHVPMPNVIPCSPWSLTTFETPLGQRLIANRDTDARCRHLIVTDHLSRHATYNFHRDCVPNPHIGAGRRVERRVDTDQSPGGIEQGPPGIAGINRRVGLDDIGSLESTKIR